MEQEDSAAMDALAESDSSMMFEHPGSDLLLVCFFPPAPRAPAAIALSQARILRRIPCHLLFLGDPLELWHYGGQPGITRSLPETATLIRKTADRLGARRIATLGLSAGTHPAIVAGVHLHAEQTLCFGMISTLAKADRQDAYRNSSRVSASLHRLWALGPEVEPFLELRTYLASQDRRPRIRIFIDGEAARDLGHSGRLIDFPEVDRSFLDGVGHDMEAMLRRMSGDPAFVASLLGTEDERA